jgi:dTMP kinase
LSQLGNGLFVTFEGGEGAGKTTLIERIFDQLVREGRQVLKTREPGGTPLGEEIRALLLHHKDPVSPYAELSLFLASRAQHLSEVILPALKAGKVVLCDRFNDSTIAYQGVARGLGMEKVAAFCQFICMEIEPHLTLYLDIDPALGLSRTKKRHVTDRIEAEDIAFHAKIRNGYLAIHKKNPYRFHLLDAAQPPEIVFHQAIKLIHPKNGT